MTLIQSQISHKGGFWSHQAPSSLSPASPSLPYNSGYEKQSSSGSKISPAVLFIIVILAVIFFISGLLHLLVRFLMKQRLSSSVSESYPELSGSDPFRRQLQQLFHLHDSGLDQAFIDALPVFLYKEIIMGSKEPFDCAVCLCEFSEKDRLRLLPTCSHAFHIDCIDTWLLSNSTCPLCRGNLLTPGIAFENAFFCFQDQREEDEFSSNEGSGSSMGQKTADNHEIINSKRVFSVRLGKYKSSDSGVVERAEGEPSCCSSSKMDVRRCYSMGSYQYVVADSDLQVTLCPDRGEGCVRGGGSAATNSVKLVKGKNGQALQSGNASVVGDVEGKKINIRSKGDSFSVSKIWQWSRKGKFSNSSETHMCSSSVTVDLPWNDHKTLGT